MSRAPAKGGHRNSRGTLSSGIASLDALFGGGIASGKVFLIEEDAHNVYSPLLVKYFLAEGVLSEDRICLLAEDVQYRSVMRELPGEGRAKTTPSGVAPGEAGDLDIAWRYAKMPGPHGTADSLRAYSGHTFDLSRRLDTDNYLAGPLFHLAESNTLTTDGQSCDATLDRLLTVVRAVAADEPSSPPLRLVLPSLGSPCWGSPSPSSAAGLRPDLTRFLLRVRACVATSPIAVALVTVPRHLTAENPGLRQRLVSLADYAVRLEAFEGSEKEANPAFRDYRGSFHIAKIPLVNSACPVARPETLDLAFKVRTQQFIIETLHLPPDLSETASRAVSRAGDACGAAKAAGLDF